MSKERIIQKFVPDRQATSTHLIAHPSKELVKETDVPDAGAVDVVTLTPGETAMIASDLALRATGVHVSFLGRLSDALMVYGSVGTVEKASSQAVNGLGCLLNHTPCETTES